MLSDILREKTDKWIAKRHQAAHEKGHAEGHAEGRAEGQAETQAEIRKLLQDWNRRRLEHEAAGKPFNEPPPLLD